MWLVPMQQGFTNQAEVTGLSILENGGFESGLLNWAPIESGDGSTAVSGSFFHSGANSLLLDLEQTSMITKAQVQGVQQSASVQNLRTLSFEAWFMTPSCSLLPGITGRVVIEIEGFTVQYNADATCGVWKPLNRNVTADFEAEFGSDAQRLFELDRAASIVVALELVRSAPDANALSEYLSIYWDDVEATAAIESAGVVSAISLRNTSETLASTTSTRLVTSAASTRELETATISSQVGSRNWIGLVVVAGLTLLALVVMTAAVVIFRRGTRKGSYVILLCPRCGRRVRVYADSRYCSQCGASLAGAAEGRLRTDNSVAEDH